MSRTAILPPPSSHSGDRQHHTGPGPGSATVVFRERPSRPMVPASPPDPFRTAAYAVTQLAQTIGDCAREVEARDGKRVARGRLEHDREAANEAVRAVFPLLPGEAFHDSPMAREALEMLEGIRLGYARETWALRIVQMGAEVVRNESARRHLEEPVRDTEPGIEPPPVLACSGDFERGGIEYQCDRPHGHGGKCGQVNARE